MTEQTDAAEVALSDIVEDLTDLPLSWDFFPEPDAALDDVARLIRAREAAAEARGAAEERAALEPLIEQARVTIAAAEARGAERALLDLADDAGRMPADASKAAAWLRARAAAGGAR